MEHSGIIRNQSLYTTNLNIFWIIMSDLSFERSRWDLHDTKYINICNSNVEISQIKGLNLTDFFTFFLKVNL